MSYFRITLHRSAIGLPKRTRGVLAALGLHRRGQIVFHPVSAQFAGMIMKVKELVKVEEVDRALSKREVHELRRPDPGFWVESVGAFQRQRQLLEGGRAEEGEVRL
ncbi:mitochondrial 54S ribosomal protein uL30m [Thermothelomyces heterothallicus CBS 202.75]|uniref:mitochondrial 54S ribosomal protein uL30m n=1 Tax=Thermothelomyces heterothallicus CBS 202.75 TaxID=1149848 RepID=UPI003742A2AC